MLAATILVYTRQVTRKAARPPHRTFRQYCCTPGANVQLAHIALMLAAIGLVYTQQVTRKAALPPHKRSDITAALQADVQLAHTEMAGPYALQQILRAERDSLSALRSTLGGG